MTNRKELSVVVVKGGFILSSSGAEGGYETEVFASASKLLKHLRTELEGDKPEKTEDKAE